MRSILELRGEKARLLGYRDFADLVLEDRMAHAGDRAQRFLEDLRHKTQAYFRERKCRFTGLLREIGTAALGYRLLRGKTTRRAV